MHRCAKWGHHSTNRWRKNCSTPNTLCLPCSHFSLAGVIATDLPHDLKPLQSHLSTYGQLFAVVGPSISPCLRNEAPVETNKTVDSLDTHELPPLDTQTNGTYSGTEFIKRIEEHGSKEEIKYSKTMTIVCLPPHCLNNEM